MKLGEKRRKSKLKLSAEKNKMILMDRKKAGLLSAEELKKHNNEKSRRKEHYALKNAKNEGVDIIEKSSDLLQAV